ncbi:hypothetical protein AAFF_G00370040 [Aldrovandia affinis]|uniref:Uncharacterized protein n=1 Tax=Aldrovandia affinis TaxID=143900 RepID=A0AAD7SGJ3_9TELE|nr:hypothetical protein AAFF_G00370040 [Aldrovandia affinis]
MLLSSLKGRRVSIFPDYTTAVAKKRASFGDVKRQLRACPGVKYGLIYPAVLRLTLPDSSTHRFEDPAVAADFIKNRIVGVLGQASAQSPDWWDEERTQSPGSSTVSVDRDMGLVRLCLED